ncbi:MAG: creatininase family protein [Actinomycetota bacterium]|jgi:creatinine amidohydrolase|nr:creatininase family protein [Actinomycetota bacterium]
MATIEWANLKAHELRALAADNAVVIAPVAALEQHGPHLPVQVDSRLATEVSRRVALKAQDTRPTVVLPVVWAGLSEHHMPFGGTITLDYRTLYSVFRCIVDSVRRHGFTDVLILNGHGGNIDASKLMAQDLTLELEGMTVVAATYWLEAASSLAPLLEDQSNVLHAGEAETSMMMRLTPDLVDDSDLASHRTQADLSFSAAGEGSYRWRDLAAVTPNGVLGDPTTANADKGERLIEAASDAIADLITNPTTWEPAPDLRGDSTGGVPFHR